MAVRGCLALGVLLLAMAHLARADDVAIRYAEPFELQLPSKETVRTSKLSQSIVTHGRRFDVELQSNERLLASIGSARRARLGSLSLYKGQLRDRHDSWVRITTVGDRSYGAIWDGIELYAIEPREDVEPRLRQPLVNRTARSLIYKLSDTEGGDDRVCGVHGERGGSRLLEYDALVSELSANATAALAPSTQIEVALIGDYEFAMSYGADATAVMVARMNIVDGIFGEQVGVSIVPMDFTVFQSPSNPFKSSNADTLLGQLGSYRAATPVIRDRGLAHLMTGRDLDGNTVGVAYLSSLCEVETGVSLSEAGWSTLQAALITAHELGHNFGAPHDGESGACSAAPPGYLMAPFLNGSTNFSSCSIERMQARASAASCLAPYQSTDAGVSVPDAPLHAIRDQIFSFPIEVSSTGQGTVTNVVVTADMFPLIPTAVSMLGADCSIDTYTATCRVAELQSGETRSMTIAINPGSVGEWASSVTVAANKDDNASNNRVDFVTAVVLGGDAILSASPLTVSAYTSSAASVDIGVASTGPLPLSDVSLDIRASGSAVTAASFGGSSCSVVDGRATCALASIPAGETRTLHLDFATGSSAGHYNGTVTIAATNDGNPHNNIFHFPIVLQPSRQLDVQITPSGAQLLYGDVITHTVQVASTGPQGVPDARLRIEVAGVMIESATPSLGTCDGDGASMSCALGTLAPGEIATIEVKSRSHVFMDGTVNVYVERFVDDTESDNHTYATFNVRHQIDVGIFYGLTGYEAYEDEISAYSVGVASYGLSAATNVTITTSVPQELSIRTAQFGQTDCEIVGNDITCRLIAPLAPDSEARFDLTYVGSEPATFGWPITVSADGDAESVNNTLDAYIQVRPYIDASISVETPLPERTRADESFALDFSIDTNHRSLSSQSWLYVTGLDRFAIESIDASHASCSIGYGSVSCVVDALAANTRATFKLYLRGLSPGPVAINIRHDAFVDVNASNNVLSMTTTLFREGDARVTISDDTVSGIVNEWINLPPVLVTATQTIDNAILEIATDYSRIDWFTMPSSHGHCEDSPTLKRCYLGVVEGGTSLAFDISMLVLSPGDLPVELRLTADNDLDPSNNESRIVVSVAQTAPPPPATRPPTSGSGGGGGGGAAGLPLLFVLLCMLLAYRSPGSIVRRRC